MRLEDEGVMAPDVAGDHVEVDRSGPRGLVISALLVDIVEVESDESRGTGRKVVLVVKKTAEVLDAGMARVVPVSDRGLVGKMGEKVVEAVVEGQFEDTLTVFHTEDEIPRDHGWENFVVGRKDPPDRAAGPSAQAVESLFPDRGSGWGIGFEKGRRISKEERCAARMHHHIPRPDARGEFEGALGVKEPEATFVFSAGRWLEKIRGGVADRGGERTEVVHRRDLDESLIHGAENTRCQFEPHSMAEFGPLKAQ